MDTGNSKRNTWIACPRCARKLARVRTCDIEFKCKHCGHEFEVIINPTLNRDNERSSNEEKQE